MYKQKKLSSTFSQKPGAPHNFAKVRQNEYTLGPTFRTFMYIYVFQETVRNEHKSLLINYLIVLLNRECARFADLCANSCAS